VLSSFAFKRNLGRYNVACGWAHSLADLFYFPVALMSGAATDAALTWTSFALAHLAPVLAGRATAIITWHFNFKTLCRAWYRIEAFLRIHPSECSDPNLKMNCIRSQFELKE